MSIKDPRLVYKPFEYPEAFEYYKKQHRAHWLADEVPLASDLNDWYLHLSVSEKNLITVILKAFTQTEVHVNDYWSTKVSKWFPKPEIAMMARCFADFESIHTEAYARLNEELGLDNFAEFLDEPSANAKILRLLDVPEKTLEEQALSLAVFSAFTEGVNLFSSFAILMSFQLRNMMKGTGQIVEWSVRDESLHSEAGCWLFRQLKTEHPELDTPQMAQNIYDACRVSVDLEFDFVQKAFEMGDIPNLTQDQIRNYIKARANNKLEELGYRSIYDDVSDDLLREMEWFAHLTSGNTHQDFFAGRSTNYSKSISDWGDL